jgi:hypothetical protein
MIAKVSNLFSQPTTNNPTTTHKVKLNTKNLKDIEIGRPLLAKGTYFAKVKSKKLEPNAAKTGQNLVLEFQVLNDDLVTHDGKKIDNRGQCVYTRWVSLVPTDKYDPDTAIKELALASGRANDDDSDFGVDDITEFMKIGLTVREAGPDRNNVHREASNDVSRFYPIKAEDNFTPPSI